MSTQIRKDVLGKARSVVIKVGSQLMTSISTGGSDLDIDYLRDMARQIVELRARRVQVTLVSSGAIAAGCAEMGLERRPRDVADQQAVAAVGQRRLMTHLHDAFAPHGLKVAQLLLTRGDFDDRDRFLNIRNCVGHLHRRDCLPVINENDTVAVEELRFGDNDLLAALTCNALRADALVLLTVVDGLLDDQGNTVDPVEDIGSVLGMARAQVSTLGTGGMITKLEAARLVTEAGEIAVVADGRVPDVLARLFAAEPLGTIFVPARRKLDSRSRWIGLTKRAAGTVTVDAGAAAALSRRGKSLLASGITGTTGQFERGEVVLIRDDAGREIARGLTNYNADELRLIMGKRSNQFQKVLHRPAYDEVVHRDNLVVVSR